MATASATPSTSTARSGVDGNELLDLREPEASEQDSTQAEHSSGSDAATTANEPTQGSGGDGLSEALKAERRRSNNLEKELRGLRQQLTRFSEINPEEYARLQEAERQKQHLEQQLELRERQMEEAAAKRVAAVSAERDAAHERVQELRKERLLERAFSEAEGRTGGDGRGTFFQVFRSMLWDCFRLGSSKDGSDALEPLDAQGQPLLGDDGRPMTTADYLDQLRIHPVYGFLFQQRGAMGTGALPAGTAAGSLGASGFGEVINPQAMSASELYRAGFALNGRSPRS
ncbi:hypothetical protein KBZ14_12510 [Synechococcus sp. HJ21-Hayes]|uniref:hypothetical protein n=1 Tax=unclassified Synechococcus TaxID=2626047 RepID=UPI0020CE7117|nr:MULTISPECIES: hypothetical protein [unclassified Synechococcus]MCP9832457.1 hypothetical protein [Synechococcus sp. JJ3a-Johnson]MCP9853683.1 hypothetical protein [Synechococcus sp. HJ21-Hayes]